MAVTPNSIVTPQAVKSGRVTQSFTANSTYSTSPTNTVKLVTAGSNGARLTKLKATPTATVSATQLQIFRSSDGGTTKNFCNSVLAASGGYTMAGTTAAPVSDLGYSDTSPMLLTAGEEVYVAVGVTGSWSWEAEWMDY